MRDFILDRNHYRCLLTLLFTFIACPAGSQAGEGEVSLEKLDTPTIEQIEGRFDVDRRTVCAWFEAIDAALAGNRFEMRVSGEMGFVIPDPEKGPEVFLKQLRFRWSEEPRQLKRRIVLASQPVGTSVPFGDPSVAVVDESRIHDFLLTPDGEIVAMYLPGTTNVSVQRKADPRKVAYMQRIHQLFHPVHACVCSVEETISGGAIVLSTHSLVAKVLVGVHTRMGRVHALFKIAHMHMLVTYIDEVPVQTLVFETEPGKEPVLSDVIRSRWAEFGNVGKMPIKIRGFRQHARGECDLECKIKWRFGDDVSEDLFDPSTLGLLSPLPANDEEK